MQNLSQSIKAQPNKKVEFIACSSQIFKLLEAGHSITFIYNKLKAENKISFSKKYFYKLIKQNISNKHFSSTPLSPAVKALPKSNIPRSNGALEGIQPSNKTIKDLW